MWQYNSLYHADRKNHKYIAKIGSGKNVRYFYTQAAYNAYKQNSTKTKGKFDLNQIRDVEATEEQKREMAEKQYEKTMKKLEDIAGLSDTEKKIASISREFNKSISVASKTVRDLASKGKSLIDKLLNR